MRVAALAVLLAWASSAGAADWPRFRGDAAMTGVAADVLPQALKLLWSAEIGESVESSAAIVGDRIYVGTQPGLLMALAAGTGSVLWKYEASNLAGVGESSPAVSGDLVFIGDLDGVLHAVDAGTGRRRWTFKTGGEIKSSPAIAGDRVLIGSYDGHLYALNRDGTLAWKARTEGPVHSTPAVRDGVAYVAGCDEMLRGFRDYRWPRGVRDPVWGVHGRVARDRWRACHLRDICERGACGRPRLPENRVALHASGSKVPVLLLGGSDRWTRLPRRSRQAAARARCGHREGGVDAAHARAHRFLAGRQRRAGLRRLERRTRCMRQMRSAERKSGSSRSVRPSLRHRPSRAGAS